SKYAVETSDTSALFELFSLYENEAKQTMEKGLIFPAYDYVLKSSHAFNILDAREVISIQERTGYTKIVIDLERGSAKSYVDERERLGFAMLKEDGGDNHE